MFNILTTRVLIIVEGSLDDSGGSDEMYVVRAERGEKKTNKMEKTTSRSSKQHTRDSAETGVTELVKESQKRLTLGD